MKKIRIGIIGAGYIAQICHLPFLEKNKYCEIIAIAEKNKDLLNKVADKYKIKKRFENHKEIVETNLNLDAVFICVNKFLASKITNFFLKNKIAVFSEKPVATNYNYAKKIALLSKKNKTPLVVGYMKRHDYGTKIIKKIFISKKFGELQNINYISLMGNSFPKNYNYIKYKKPFVKVKLNKILNTKIKNKKIFIDFLNTHSHGLNLIRYYIGDKNKLQFYKKNLNKQIIFFRHKNKSIKFNYKFNFKNNWNERILIVFDKAKITQIFPAPQLRNKSSKVVIQDLKTKKKETYYNHTWSFEYQANNFINCILNNKVSICKIDNCLDDLKMIEKIF